MITLELNVTTRTERELLVEVRYALDGNAIEFTAATTIGTDCPLTAFEWEQIEAATEDHCADVLAELRDEECPAVRRAA